MLRMNLVILVRQSALIQSEGKYEYFPSSEFLNYTSLKRWMTVAHSAIFSNFCPKVSLSPPIFENNVLLHRSSILLLESPCPFVRSLVRSLVTFFTPSNAHNISATKRATGDLLVSKRPDFRGLFETNLFLDFWSFWISGFFLDFWLYLGNGKSYRSSGDPLVSKHRFSRAFWIF